MSKAVQLVPSAALPSVDKGDNMKKIQLWIGAQLSNEYMLVDNEDYEMVMEASRSYTKTGKLRKQSGRWRLFHPTPNLKYGVTYSGPYTDRSSGRNQAFVHRLIMGFPEGMHIDHINGNALDNRKENLRICTPSQNAMNKKLRSDSTTGYKGVYKVKDPRYKKKYSASGAIPGTSGKKKRLGYFATAAEAARAYNDYAIKEFGEFAYLNEIKE